MMDITEGFIYQIQASLPYVLLGTIGNMSQVDHGRIWDARESENDVVFD